MIGFGGLGFLFALLALFQMRRGRTPHGKWFLPAMIFLPFLANNSLFISPARWIEVSSEEAIDVDTPADLEAVRQAARNLNA
jgi:hypothetical protein